MADVAHRGGDSRSAATLLRWARGVTRKRSQRERRWLDGLFEALLARDLAEVSGQLPEIAWATDAPRRALVQGALRMAEKHWLQAVEAFESVAPQDLCASDPLTVHRLQVMLAWSELMTGADTQRVVAAVHAAEAAGAADPAVGGYLQLARGQLRSRMPGQWERWRLVADVPSDVTAVPTSRSHELAWRGSVFALAGRFDDGIADLREFTGRVREGAAEFGDGMFHAVLGYALWMRGDREQARIPIGVAVESRLASAHPLVQAIAPLRRIGTGDLDQARRLLADAFDGIRRAPFSPAIQVAGVVGTVIELVDGAPERRRALLPLLRRTLGDRAVDLSGAVSPLWRLHLGLVAAWAGETGLATTVAGQLERAPSELGSALRRGALDPAQVRLANGDDNAARTELRSAVELGLTGLPLHADRLAADLARLEHREPNGSSKGSPNGATDPLDLLSDRERDVVSLLTEGLSYAQIARELYVTRSTVAFHLSNAYAKTNTTSRRELVALVRAHR